jgi:hypothetical protein
MGLISSIGGWGIILLGAFFLGIGYVLTEMPAAVIGSRMSPSVGTNFNQIGFTLVVAGFLAWFFLGAWRRIMS